MCIRDRIQKLARSLPPMRSTELRMAIGNIRRPGSLTHSVVLSLGLGLALLVALAQIDGNLRRQLTSNIPQHAPDFFFVDIQNSEQAAFTNLLQKQVPEAKLLLVPMLRGRITTPVSYTHLRAHETVL